jgi:intracellular septation protein
MLIFQLLWRMYLVFFLFSMAIFPLTLVLKNDPFLIQWKPTYYYGLFGISLIISGLLSKKGLIGLIKPNGIDMPLFIWPKIDLYYSVVFLLIAFSNALVVLFMSEDVWVNFKLLVPLPSLVVYSIIVSLLVSVNIIKYEKHKA